MEREHLMILIHNTNILEIYIKIEYNGYGKYYLNNNLIYDGQFKEGKYHGLGKEYKGNNVEYIGEFNYKKRKGYGVKLDYDIYGNISDYN